MAGGGVVLIEEALRYGQPALLERIHAALAAARPAPGLSTYGNETMHPRSPQAV